MCVCVCVLLASHSFCVQAEQARAQMEAQLAREAQLLAQQEAEALRVAKEKVIHNHRYCVNVLVLLIFVLVC